MATNKNVAIHRDFQGLFNGGRVPKSARSLICNLRELDDDVHSSRYETIGIVYKAFVTDINDVERKKFFGFVIDNIKRGSLNPVAVLPFIRFESNHQLVGTAVWTYLKYRKSTLENPLIAAHEIVSVLEQPDVINRGAAYAGLICFGDRRVCTVARTMRDSITPAEARAFSAVATPLNRATIDYYMEWMVKTASNHQFDIAVPVSFALSAMIVQDASLVVHDKEYNFGPYGFSTFTNHADVSLEDLLTELKPILDVLSSFEKPALNHMIKVFNDPLASTLEHLEQRKAESRRKKATRRASDRRIVDIAPRINLRAAERRGEERRHEARR